MNDKTIIIRVDETLKKKLQTMADMDNRKLSDFIRLHLIELTNKSKAK